MSYERAVREGAGEYVTGDEWRLVGVASHLRRRWWWPFGGQWVTLLYFQSAIDA